MYWLEFNYDKRGFGRLRLFEGGVAVIEYDARTGSINRLGLLVKAIRPGVWTLREVVDTTEIAMVIGGHGWKARLWTPEGAWSHYLAHPDAGLPGTDGCIGIQRSPALDLKSRLIRALAEQGQVPVYINTERKENTMTVQEKRTELEHVTEMMTGVKPDTKAVEAIAKAAVGAIAPVYDAAVNAQKGQKAAGTSVVVVAVAGVLYSAAKAALARAGVDLGPEAETAIPAAIAAALTALISYFGKRFLNRRKIAKQGGAE